MLPGLIRLASTKSKSRNTDIASYDPSPPASGDLAEARFSSRLSRIFFAVAVGSIHPSTFSLKCSNCNERTKIRSSSTEAPAAARIGCGSLRRGGRHQGRRARRAALRDHAGLVLAQVRPRALRENIFSPPPSTRGGSSYGHKYFSAS